MVKSRKLVKLPKGVFSGKFCKRYMDIHYLGHSAFRIKTKSAVVVTDPFDNTIGLKFPKVTADIVTVSHAHSDHKNTEAVGDVKKIVEGPGEYEIMGVSIIGLASFHDDKKGEDRGKNTVFIFEAEGLRIAHFGDLGHTLSEKFYEEMGDIDIALVPVGGIYTIDSDQAADIVKTLEPSIVIPMHYQVEGLDPKEFSELAGVDKFIAELGFTTETLPKLSVNVASLSPEDQKIVVLNRLA